MRSEGEIRFPDEWNVSSHDDCKLDDARNEWITWVRQVRGGVLTGSYEIERNLSGFVEFYLLGPRAADKKVRQVFEEHILASLTFERRINCAMQVAKILLPANEVKTLQSRLSEMKSLRNAMAHNPCWFEPYLDHEAKVARLRPKMMKGKQEIAMDGDWVEKMNAEMISLIEETGRLVHLTLGPARAEADKPDS